MSLLEKAKNVPVYKSDYKHHSDDSEIIELAIAWLKKEVTTTQVSEALYNRRNSGNVVYMMGFALREAYKKGLIKENK